MRSRRGTAQIVVATQHRLQALRPIINRVLAQTRARLLGGDIHVPDKVISVFEPLASEA